MATPILSIGHWASSQNQPDVTVNAAFDDLEAALLDFEDLGTLSANHTVTSTEWTENVAFQATPDADARQIIIPTGTQKFFAVINESGTYYLTVIHSGGSTSINVPAGKNLILYSDGTANGLFDLASGSTASTSKIIAAGTPTTIATSEEVLRFTFPWSATLSADFGLSVAKLETATGGSTSLTIAKNGTGFGTLAFNTSATGVFAMDASPDADISFAAGDILTVATPANMNSGEGLSISIEVDVI